MTVRVGTSGWHYPSGRGSWNGVFYPPRSGAGRGRFDELAFYAEHFDTVEVNSTFYRIPPAAMTRSWATRTPRGFEFAVKLFQGFTHPEMQTRATAGETPQPADADVDGFRRAIEPLAEAGKLGPVLAQFPPSFKRTAANCDYLSWLLSRLGDVSVAVELRDRSWSDALPDTRALLDASGATLTLIDEPKFGSSIRQDPMAVPTSWLYIRLHGRNAAQWWTHAAVEDRYDYLYSAEELEPYIAAAEGARRLEKKVYLYMNNHFESKAVANAVMVRHRLGLPLPGALPETFLQRFPELRPLVSTPGPRRGLF